MTTFPLVVIVEEWWHGYRGCFSGANRDQVQGVLEINDVQGGTANEGDQMVAVTVEPGEDDEAEVEPLGSRVKATIDFDKRPNETTSWKLGLVRAQWGHIVGPRGLGGGVAPHSCGGGFDGEGSFGIL